MDFFQVFSILITLAALFSYISYRYLRLPTTIGVMLIAMLSSLVLVALGKMESPIHAEAVKMVAGINFDRLLLHGLLAFLLFAGALHVDINDLARQWAPISLLALVGTMASIFLIAAVTWLVAVVLSLKLPFVYCMLFGALISPTDPIAVMGILRTAGAPREMEIQIAGESLFNDGVGVVMFLAVLDWITDPAGVSVSHVALMLGEEIAGGVGFGLLVGYLTFQLLKRVDHYQVEVLLTLALAMGGYAGAEAVHVSAPIAIVVAGLLIGNHGRHLAMSVETQRHLDTFWELLDEILNALLFLFLGLALLVVPISARYLWAGVLAIPITLFARWLVVMGMAKTMKAPRGTIPILTWGGLRGGISVALALSLPEDNERGLLLAVTYCVVVFSVLVQGLTVGPLVKRLTPPSVA